MKNTYTKIIDNCLSCEHHFVQRIWTPDSWEHEYGCYCEKKNNKLVGSDDWHLEKYTDIPDWCPMLNKE